MTLELNHPFSSANGVLLSGFDEPKGASSAP